MKEIVALGELLIDFTVAGTSERGHVLFEQNPGGAPANVLAALTQLGCDCSFIGKVGDDEFGRFLKETLDNLNINTSSLELTKLAHTTLAFVHLTKRGERSFSFYRKPGADTMLDLMDINEKQFANAKIFHFGSLSMTVEPTHSATLKALKLAKEAGCIISYDPNLRIDLWPDLDTAKEIILSVMDQVDILKVSESELEFMTGKNDVQTACQLLREQWGIPVILVTSDEEGSYYYWYEHFGKERAFPISVVDSTGAGDAFTAGVLYGIFQNERQLKDLEEWEIKRIMSFGNKMGAYACTKRGAIFPIPGKETVEALS